MLTRRAASNIAAVKMDLASAILEGDADRVTLLQTLIDSGGDILLYRPQLQHYAVLFGDIETAAHVAVFVPGVGDGTNLCDDWIPEARNLFEAAPSTAVVLWKGYDNPADIAAAATDTIECNEDLLTAAGDLTAFVEWLSLDPEQSVTLVAHSFGSIVAGAALAECDLHVTDVVVAGSPGMTVDELRQLHLDQSHFFSEQAPGDAIAELGIFGAAPTAPTFGGTRMSTNAPDHPTVEAHSNYFEQGSRGAREHGRRGDRPVLRRSCGTDSPSPRSPGDWWPGPSGCRRGRCAWPGGTTAAPASGAGELVPPGRPRGERDGQPRLSGTRRGRAGADVGRPPPRRLPSPRAGGPDPDDRTASRPGARRRAASPSPSATAGRTMASMDVVVSEPAGTSSPHGVASSTSAPTHRCCSGPMTLLDTTTEEPEDSADFAGCPR